MCVYVSMIVCVCVCQHDSVYVCVCMSACAEQRDEQVGWSSSNDIFWEQENYEIMAPHGDVEAE